MCLVISYVQFVVLVFVVCSKVVFLCACCFVSLLHLRCRCLFSVVCFPTCCLFRVSCVVHVFVVFVCLLWFGLFCVFSLIVEFVFVCIYMFV